MSKFDPVWSYIRENDISVLTFDEIQEIAGIPIDHSFLKYKKELLEYGYQVKKISMKEKKVLIGKIKTENR